VFLIHGTADSQIGVQHTRALQGALSENVRAQTWLVAGADHGQAWARHQSEYEQQVLGFLNTYLGGKHR
jgi:dipeptidyl aminopeptidase/acylaminoacyl peptidase